MFDTIANVASTATVAILVLLTASVFLPVIWKALDWPTFFRWFSAVVTVVFGIATVVALYPATRWRGIYLAFFSFGFALWSYGGYLSYVRGQTTLGNELSQGVKWLILGILITSIFYYTVSLSPELVFAIPVVFTTLTITYRLAVRDRFRMDGLTDLEFLFVVGVIAVALAVTYLHTGVTAIRLLLLAVVVCFIGWQAYRRQRGQI